MDATVIYLHQLSMRYSNEQDRIEFLFSSTENKQYRVWLTRRFVKLMWQALMKIVSVHPEMGAGFEPHVRDAILGLQHQESVQALNVSRSPTPKTDQSAPATGENKAVEPEPLLVTGCTSRVRQKGASLSLELIVKDGTNVGFYLNKEILHSLFHLLMQATTEAEWDLGLQVGDPHVSIPEQGRPVH